MDMGAQVFTLVACLNLGAGLANGRLGKCLFQTDTFTTCSFIHLFTHSFIQTLLIPLVCRGRWRRQGKVRSGTFLRDADIHGGGLPSGD